MRVVDRGVRLARDHLEQQVEAVAPAGVGQDQHLPLLLAAELLGVVGMVEDQALDAVLGGPSAQGAAQVRPALEAQGPRARQLDRPADPQAFAGGVVQRVLAEAAVEQDAAVAAAVRGHHRRTQRQPLEVGDVLGAGADAGAHLLELDAVVEGEGQHLRPVPAAVGGPVHLLEPGVLAQPAMLAAGAQKALELAPGRDRRGAAMARDGEGAAGVGQPAAFRRAAGRAASRAGSRS